jgi:protein TonB
MELKKSPKADLENKRLFFREIALVFVLVIMLVAFEWGTKEITVQKIEFTEDIVEEEEIQNTEQEEQKPPEQAPVPVLSDVIVVVDDNIKLTTDMDLFDADADDKTAIAIMDYVDVGDEDALEDDIPFTAVEEPASFRGGGVEAFRKWIGENIRYPEVATENGIQGRVIVQFTVNTEGKVVNVKVLRGVDPALDKEAIRIIESSPKWTPGKQRNKPVRILYTLPVIFQLQ